MLTVKKLIKKLKEEGKGYMDLPVIIITEQAGASDVDTVSRGSNAGEHVIFISAEAPVRKSKK